MATRTKAPTTPAIEPGMFVLYDGNIAAVIGVTIERSVILEVQGTVCSLCGHAERIVLGETSLTFRDKVRPVPTLGAPPVEAENES